MSLHDTTLVNNLEESTQAYIRQLAQHLDDLGEAMRSQQEALRRQGMDLSAISQEAYRALRDTTHSLSAQTQAMHQELRHLNALAETTALINSILEPDDVLAAVMDKVIELTGAERGFIMLRSRATGELEFKIARGLDGAHLIDDQFTVSQTIINQVVSSGESTLTDNATDDPRFQDQQSIVGFSLRSIMAAPLKVRDEVIGVVYCDNRIFSGMFKPQDLNMLADFANQAAIALENARLFESARAHLAEVRATSDLLGNVLDSIVSGVITVSPDGIVNTCNPSAADIFGISTMDVEGTPFYELLPPVLRDDFEVILQRVQQQGTQELIQVEPVLEGRGHCYWNMVISPLLDQNGATQGVAIVLDDLTETRQREEQLTQVRRYLPAALVSNLRVIDVAGVAGEERLITAISTDVRGFTSFSERLEPEALMQIINRYLSLASDAISFYKGVVDKFMGDAVTGLFNTQLNPQDDHAVRAVRAALGLLSDLRALHEVMPPEQRLYYGVGIHSGMAVLGNVGNDDRREFSAVGEAMEISKILEGNARGGEIIISEATHALVQEYFECEPFTPEKTKGRDDLKVAYRVIRLKKSTGPISLDDFEI